MQRLIWIPSSFVLVVGLGLFVPYWAQDDKSETEDLKPVMIQFLNHITQLFPYMVKEDRFTDPQNSDVILENLEALSTLSEEISHHPEKKSPGFRISSQALESHLAKIPQVFSEGNKSYAKHMLKATLDGCSSCHVQYPRDEKILWDLEHLELEARDFERAELLFSIRNYTAAKPLYKGIIENYPDSEMSRAELDRAIKRVLSVDLRVEQNFEDAKESIQDLIQQEALPAAIRKQGSRWLSALNTLEENREPTEPEEVIHWAKSWIDVSETQRFQSLDDTSWIVYLYVSGVLYKLLHREEGLQTVPEALYLLATCESWLDDHFFFSLSELYLRECIERFPDTNTAQKCFESYKEQITLSYTGSAGIQIPEDVEEDLKNLEQKLN